MSDYRDNIGKKKQRQTGYLGRSFSGSSGGSDDDGGDDDGGSSFGGGYTTFSSGSSDSGGSDDSDDDDDSGGGGGSNDGGGGGGFLGGIQDTVDDAVSGAQDTVDDAVDTAQDTADDVTDTAQDTVDDATDSLPTFSTPDVGNLVPDAQAPDAGEVIDNASGEIDDAVGDAQDAVSDAGGAVDDAVSDAQDTFDDATDTIDDAVVDAQDTAEDAFSDVTGGAEDTFDDVTGGAEDAFDEASSAFDDFTSDAEDAVSDATEDVGDAFGDAADQAGDFGDDVGDTVDDAVGSTEDAFSGFFDDAGDAVDDAAGGLQDVAEGASGTVDDAISGAGGVIDSVADTVVFGPGDTTQDFIRGIANEVGGIGGGGVVNQLGDTTSNVAETFTDTARNLGGAGQGGSQVKNQGDEPVQWTELQQITTVTGAVIFKQESTNTPDQRVRFFAIGQDQQGNTIAYGADNKAVRVDSVDTLGELPHFSSSSAAKDVVPHRNGRATDRRERQNRPEYSSPEKVNQIGPVSILQQTGQRPDGNQVTRFFSVTRTDEDQLVLLQSATEVVRMNNIDTMNDAPSFGTQREAEEVAQAYAQRISGGEQGGSGEGEETTTEDSPRAGTSPSEASDQPSTLGSDAPLGLSPRALGAGALVIGGGLYTLFSGDSAESSRTVDVSANTTNGQNGR